MNPDRMLLSNTKLRKNTIKTFDSFLNPLSQTSNSDFYDTVSTDSVSLLNSNHFPNTVMKYNFVLDWDT